MPTEKAHVALASHNQEVIDYLALRIQEFPDWVATVAFYKALQIVEAVFANDKTIRHQRRHEDRDRCLKKTKRYENIWRHYHPLWAASMIARYLECGRGKGHYATFSDYMGPKEVEDTLIKHHLKQLTRSAKRFLSARSKQAIN